MKRALILISLSISSTAWADFTQWSPAKELAEPRDTAITLNVSGETQYSLKRAWVADGLYQGDRKRSDVKYEIFYFAEEKSFGNIRVSEAVDSIGWLESTATQRAQYWAYWKDKTVDPTDSGTFVFHGIVLKWIAFPHLNNRKQNYQCANFTADGRAERFQVFGFWCVQGSRPLSGADVSAFVNAIGYKDVLKPQPLSALPGK